MSIIVDKLASVSMELDAVARIAAIEASGVLLASRAEAFNAVCKMANTLLGVDCSQLNVVSAHEQIFVAEWPRPKFWRKPTPLSNSGCREVVLAEHLIAIEDTHEHPTTCVMPWVQDWRGYIGAPVIYQEQIIGSLCGLTKKTRVWSSRDCTRLLGLAAQISDLL